MAKFKKTDIKANGQKRNMLTTAICVVLATLGFAFLMQGIALQWSRGLLYYGLLHYLVAFILFAVAGCCKKCR